MNAERKLRGQITRVLSVTGIDHSKFPHTAKEVEDQTVELFRAYISAPEDERDAVYTKREEKIVNVVRNAGTVVFYLVRHGHGGWLDKNIYCTRTNRSLSDQGRERVKLLAERLAAIPFDIVYTSDLSRASETAQLLVGRRHISICKRPDLREIDVGEWEGLSGEEIDRRYPGWRIKREKDPFSVTPPGGESLNNAVKRLSGFLQELDEKHTEGSILIVAHQNVLRLLITLLLEISPKWLRRFDVETASLTVISRSANSSRLEHLNDTSHFEDFGLPHLGQQSRAGFSI